MESLVFEQPTYGYLAILWSEKSPEQIRQQQDRQKLIIKPPSSTLSLSLDWVWQLEENLSIIGGPFALW